MYWEPTYYVLRTTEYMVVNIIDMVPALVKFKVQQVGADSKQIKIKQMQIKQAEFPGENPIFPVY